MKINQTINATPNFQALSEDQIERIYFAALDVLTRTGCRVCSKRALQLLKGSEAVVSDDDLVRVPPALAERALKAHPRKLTLTGRTGAYPLRLQKDEVHFGTGFHLAPGDDQVGLHREASSAGLLKAAQLADSLPSIDFFMAQGCASPDGKKGLDEARAFHTLVQACTKPMILSSRDLKGLSNQWRMACILRGGEEALRLYPLFIAQVRPVSPLVLTEAGLEQLLFCAEKGLPCLFVSSPVAGATAPLSIAGLLVQTLAEGIMGSVISYLKKPGLPYVLGGMFSFGQDRQAWGALGAPELSLSQAAYADIVKWLGLPVFSTGGCSDSPALEEQAAVEMATSLLYGFLSGANLVHHIGFLDSGRTASLEGILLCDEIIGMIKQIGRGINTDDEYLALEVITEIGPGGEFLTTDHTLDHFHEWYVPKYLDRADFATWSSMGGRSMLDNLRAARERVLAEHRPEPLPQELDEELQRARQ
jgi:trimethylamine--corrinoid protein Co-methyltransferase